MAEMTQIEVWLLVDAAGDFAIAKDEGDLHQAYADDIGGDPDGLRKVKVTVNVPLPTVIEVEANCPEEGVETTAAVDA